MTNEAEKPFEEYLPTHKFKNQNIPLTVSDLKDFFLAGRKSIEERRCVDCKSFAYLGYGFGTCSFLTGTHSDMFYCQKWEMVK